jgi:hypothetical protein
MPTAAEQALAVGDRFRFYPRGGSGNRWWTLRARDERYLVATCPAPFRPKGELWYCVVDLRWTSRRNGSRPGMIRSSLNVLGGGWPYDAFDQEAFDQVMVDLNRGTWELSVRRLLAVDRIEVAR